METNSTFFISPLEQADLVALKKFTDEEIGTGYYSERELEEIFSKSKKNGQMCSFLLKNGNEILGVRISYPPGNWNSGKGKGLSLDQWPHDLEKTAYFQSLFLSSKVQGMGWGAKLSLRAIESLQKVGAQGIVCHSWKESPHNSSSKYLEKIGFKKVIEHPKYWQFVNYECTLCGKPPCQCTAIEMYLDLAPQG